MEETPKQSEQKIIKDSDYYINLPPKLGLFYHTPLSLPTGEWKKWADKVSKKWPFQYLIREISKNIYKFCYFWTKNKFNYYKCKLFTPFNIIKLRSLPPTYNDTDIILESALEQLFIDYIEIEKPFEVLSFDENEDSKKLKEKLLKIYNYFKIDRPLLEKELNKLDRELFSHNKGDIFNMLDPDARTSNIFNDINKLEQQIWLENTKIYAEIILIRSNLWT